MPLLYLTGLANNLPNNGKSEEWEWAPSSHSWLTREQSAFYHSGLCAYGLPRYLRGKESACQGGRPGFNPWVGKVPWRRKWQSTPVSLPGKSHGQRNLVGNSPRGHKESDTTEWLSTHTCVRIPTCAHTYTLHKRYMNTFIWWNVQIEKSKCSKVKAKLAFLSSLPGRHVFSWAILLCIYVRANMQWDGVLNLFIYTHGSDRILLYFTIWWSSCKNTQPIFCTLLHRRPLCVNSMFHSPYHSTTVKLSGLRLKSNDIRWKYPSISSLLRGSICRNRWVFSVYWKDSLGGGYTKLRGKKALYNLKKILSLVSIFCDLKKASFSATYSWAWQATCRSPAWAQGLGVSQLAAPLTPPPSPPPLPVNAHHSDGTSPSVCLSHNKMSSKCSTPAVHSPHSLACSRPSELCWVTLGSADIKFPMLFSFFHILCNAIVILLIYTCICVFYKKQGF